MMFWQHSSEHGNRQTCSLRLRPSLPSLSFILNLNLTFQLPNLLAAVLLALEKARKHPEKHSHKFKREGNSLRLTFMTHQIMAFFFLRKEKRKPPKSNWKRQSFSFSIRLTQSENTEVSHLLGCCASSSGHYCVSIQSNVETSSNH